MDRPEGLDATSLQDAKAALFADLRPFKPRRGPSSASTRGSPQGGRDPPESRTETFVALRAEIDSRSLAGRPVPPEDRQGDGRGPPRRHGRLSATRGRSWCRSTDASRRLAGRPRHGADRRSSHRPRAAREAAGAGAGRPPRADGTRRGAGAPPRGPRGLREAAARRDARRPLALHPRGRGRAALGAAGRPAGSRRRRSPRPYPRGAAGAPTRPPRSPPRPAGDCPEEG